jgi:AcrR family transcriptional regulator
VAVQRGPRVGRRPGNQDTRGQIITAARHAFATKGFAGASIRGIAAEAGVDAALIHHYFDSKQQLFLATVALPLGLPRMPRTSLLGAGPASVNDS